MMITPEKLFSISNIVPSDFGKEVIPVDVTDPEEQMTLALAHISDVVLPGAESEVSVPVMRASEGYGIPLPESVVRTRYPNISDAGIASINSQLQTLYDEAVKSYARSEINKQVSSSSKGYDEDSDAGRETADAQLQKLLDTLTDILSASKVDNTSPEKLNSGLQPSRSMKTSFTF